MLELVLPPAVDGQQYTLSQYSRAQKSTSGGLGPGGPGVLVGRTGDEGGGYFILLYFILLYFMMLLPQLPPSNHVCAVVCGVPVLVQLVVCRGGTLLLLTERNNIQHKHADAFHTTLSLFSRRADH